MKKVAVLLSSYNGEKYIGRQIASIVAQTYSNLELYIRDDGSSDTTVSIIKEYADKYENVHFIESDGNLGYPACFYALTDDESIQADYYAFADQDDYWYPGKIERAVARLEMESANMPCSYYAGYMYCDGDLRPQSRSDRRRPSIPFAQSIFEVCGLEFTQVVNASAMKLIRTYKPQKASARGTWMSPLIAGLGKVIYDNYTCAAYRRHESAVTNSDMGTLGIWIWRIKEFCFGGFDEYKILLQDLDDVLSPMLSKKDQKVLKTFIQNDSFEDRLKKVFFPKRLRNKPIDELALRVAFLFGML